MLRPAASPLLWRLRLPFEVMLPRIEQLENRLGVLPSVRESIDNLTRTWLRLQNEVSRLASSVPDAAVAAAQGRVAEFEQRVQSELERLAKEMPEAANAARARASELEARVAETERQLRDEVAGRGRRVDDTLRFLLDRVEFVRREALLELRYRPGNGSAPHAAPQAVQPRILAPEKVQAARASGALRLNVGCGHIPMADYINVDMRDLPGVDVLAEAGALPFEPGTVDEIAATHLVEHFPQEEMRRRILPHWATILKPGGRLRAVVPDGEAMLAGVAQGTYAFEDFREVLFGSQDYDGDFHYNLLTPDSLRALVEQAGLTGVEVPVRGRRNGQCFEFELVAYARSQ
jgi:hypothetical protein